ncbi:MAG: hypothetical protein JJ855_15730 [Rhodospirillales bacterium]|nr:hypothetical protein [Rhodospirillales bacterium]
MRSYIALAAIFFSATPFAAASVSADQPAVLDVTSSANPDGTYAIHATVTHRDEGWRHYADKWEVMTADGKVVATRQLYHPHVDEQPFTRSLSRVEVPIGTTEVTVRAFCNKDGAGTRTFTVQLPPRK